GGEVDAVLRRFVETNLSDWHFVIVHPQERKRVVKFHAKRVDDVPNAIDRWCGRRPGNHPAAIVDGLGLKTKIGAIVHRSPPQTISISKVAFGSSSRAASPQAMIALTMPSMRSMLLL